MDPCSGEPAEADRDFKRETVGAVPEPQAGPATVISTVPVTTQTLVARCNRVLAKDGRSLRVNKPVWKFFRTAGYNLIGSDGLVAQMDIDLLELAKELGCLKSYEAVTG